MNKKKKRILWVVCFSGFIFGMNCILIFTINGCSRVLLNADDVEERIQEVVFDEEQQLKLLDECNDIRDAAKTSRTIILLGLAAMMISSLVIAALFIPKEEDE